jgi:hypothetical protein
MEVVTMGGLTQGWLSPSVKELASKDTEQRRVERAWDDIQVSSLNPPGRWRGTVEEDGFRGRQSVSPRWLMRSASDLYRGMPQDEEMDT